MTSTTIPQYFNETGCVINKNDNELQTLRSLNRSLKLEDMILPTCADTTGHSSLHDPGQEPHKDKDTLVCDTSTGTRRPYVLAQYRRQVFDALHSLQCLCFCGLLYDLLGTCTAEISSHEKRLNGHSQSSASSWSLTPGSR